MPVELWTEKYRPRSLDDFVWANPATRALAEKWLQEGSLPHLLLSGKPGTGKTSLARLLLRLLGVPDMDIQFVNASRTRKVDDIDNIIRTFFRSWAMGESGIKYLLMDEFDGVSMQSQKALRAEMEINGVNTRVIATCNYPNKIMHPLMGRFQTVDFQTMDRDSFLERAGEVLERERVSFDIETLTAHVDFAYPDLRHCINVMQKQTLGGKLELPSGDPDATRDYMVEAANLFKAGEFLRGRRMIVAKAQVEDYDGIYRFLYENLDLFGSTQDQQDDALLAIRKSLVNNAYVADVEINLAACLVDLSRIAKPLNEQIEPGV